MQNLLPSVPNKLEETLNRVDRISNWRPDDADPVKATIDRKLFSQFTVDKVEVVKYRQPQVPKPEPNYVSPIDIGSVGPSPLNAAVRAEEVEETIINMEGMRIDSGIPAFIKPKKKKVSTKFDHFLFTKFYSKMPISTDLYVQKIRTMKVMGLKPFDELLRLIEGDPKHAEFVGYNGVHVLCSPLIRSTVAMTTRREIKEYHFNKYDRIGLEVEMIDGKLTCTRVIPGTQAAPHSLYLNSAEIVGVNGERVLTLEEFQKAMQRAKQEKFFLGEIPDEKEMESPIVLTVAAFKGGKSKVDDVFLHSFAQRERMKSLFSNIFSSSGGGRKNSHKSDGDSHNEDDETSFTSADNESQDESVDEEEDDDGSVYVQAAEAARRAVEGDDAKEEGSIVASRDDRRESQVSVSGSIKSVKSSNSLTSNGHTRRRHLDSDDEDDAKESNNIVGGRNTMDNYSDSDDCEAEKKYSSSEMKSDAKTDSKMDGNTNEMKVSSVHMQRSLDLWYGGGDDENGAMRAGRKTVVRDTVAPEVVEMTKKEPTPPPTPPPPVVEEEPKPVVKNKKKKLERPPTILPFTSLACVPSSLKGSIDWGLPESYIQFTNFTTHGSWKMEIFWVDNEGAMVSRRELKSGLTHMDMCTADHVWAIIARPHYDSVIKPNGYLDASTSTLQQNSSLLVHDKSTATINENSTADHQKHNPELIDVKQPLIMVFRPCSMALQEGKCLSIIWTPWQSLSVSHIIHPQTSKTRAKKHSMAVDHNNSERIQPVMHIQLFETPKQRLQAVADQRNISNNVDAAIVDNNSNRDDQSNLSDSHTADDLISAAGDGGSVHSHYSTLQSSVKSQHTTYSTIQRTLEDFKAAIKATDSRYQSKRDLFDTNQGIGKIQRKPLVTSGALHRMRKDHK